MASAFLSDEGNYLTSVTVERAHRRRGVATHLYRAIEHSIGRKLRPSPTRVSPDAEAFWKMRGRGQDNF